MPSDDRLNQPGEENLEEVKGSRNAVFTFRLPREELESLTRAAELAGESATEYVRKAIKMRQERVDLMADPQGAFAVGTQYMQTGSMVSWTEARTDARAEARIAYPQEEPAKEFLPNSSGH